MLNFSTQGLPWQRICVWVELKGHLWDEGVDYILTSQSSYCRLLIETDNTVRLNMHIRSMLRFPTSCRNSLGNGTFLAWVRLETKTRTSWDWVKTSGTSPSQYRVQNESETKSKNNQILFQAKPLLQCHIHKTIFANSFRVFNCKCGIMPKDCLFVDHPATSKQWEAFISSLCQNPFLNHYLNQLC